MEPKRRGKKRLWSVTYETLSHWTGLSEGHLRNLAAAGEFEGLDLPGVLAWCNRRRQRAGLSLIGQPAPLSKPPPHIVRGDDGKLYLRANSG